MRSLSALPAVLFLPFLLFCGSTAASPPNAEQDLAQEIADLDRIVERPGGAQAVLARIEQEFGVPPSRVQVLRQRGAGYGKIVALLSLARTLPGGARPGNIDRVRSLCRGRPPRTWGQVAEELGADLGAVVSQVRQVREEAHRLLEQGGPAPVSPAVKRRPDFSGEGKALPRGRAAD